MESARVSFFEEYKQKGNEIMLKFNRFTEVGEIIANG